MTKHEQDVIKMYHITTIQAIAEKIGQKFDFQSLWKQSNTYLEGLIHDMVIVYNDNLKEGKKC